MRNGLPGFSRPDQRVENGRRENERKDGERGDRTDARTTLLRRESDRGPGRKPSHHEDEHEDAEEELGETYPDITNSEKLATLLALSVAEDVLCESKTLDECWDCRLTEENLEAIKEEL